MSGADPVALDVSVRRLKASFVEMVVTAAERRQEIGWEGVVAALTKRQAATLNEWADGDFSRDLTLSALVRVAHALDLRLHMQFERLS